MSVRVRVSKPKEGVKHGSLFSSAIDVKPGFAFAGPSPPPRPCSDVGVYLVDDANENAHFKIEFFYGAVGLDNGAGIFTESDPDQKHLRLKLTLIRGRLERKQMAELISLKILDAEVFKTGVFDQEGKISSYDVCTDDRASYISISYKQIKDTAVTEFDFKPLARAIFGVDEEVSFLLEKPRDKYMYKYTLEQNDGAASSDTKTWKANMTIQRNGLHNTR